MSPKCGHHSGMLFQDPHALCLISQLDEERQGVQLVVKNNDTVSQVIQHISISATQGDHTAL